MFSNSFLKKEIKLFYNNIEIIPLSDKVEDYKILHEDLVSNEIKELVEQIKCSICLNIVKEPTSCKNCQALFCKICINKWLRENMKCPMNCRKFEHQEVLRATINVINKIKFKCVKYLEGCNKIITIENYEKHLRECNFIKYKCFYCKFTSNYNDTNEHSKICLDSFTECKFCKIKIKLKKFIFNSWHSEEKCLSSLGNKTTLFKLIF